MMVAVNGSFLLCQGLPRLKKYLKVKSALKSTGKIILRPSKVFSVGLYNTVNGELNQYIMVVP